MNAETITILEEIEAVLRDRMRAATKVAGEKIDLANDLRDRGENYMEVYSESVAMVHYSQAYEAAAQIVSDFKNGARIDVVATAMNNPEVRDIMKTFGL